MSTPERETARALRDEIEAAGRQAEITASGGATIPGSGLFALPGGAGTRVTFLLTPGDADTSDLRLSLAGADGAPVWLHRWTRARDGGV